MSQIREGIEKSHVWQVACIKYNVEVYKLSNEKIKKKPLKMGDIFACRHLAKGGIQKTSTL